MDNYIDPTDLIARDKLEAERLESAERARLEESEIMQWIMNDKRGRKFIWQLLAFTGVFRNPFRGTKETDFLCGMMNVGQKYLGDINEYTPEMYNVMVEERLK